MKLLTQTNSDHELLDGADLSQLLHLPHKILAHHDNDYLAHMVLHELGHNKSLGLQKAGYLVDNPDFDCVRGIAGYCQSECPMHKQNVWETPESFAADMKDAQFHKQLSSFVNRGLQRNDQGEFDSETMKALGNSLGIANPSFITWRMKHGNHGILLFEDQDAGALARRRSLLENYAAFLSLC